MKDTRGRQIKQGDIVVAPRKASRSGAAKPLLGVYIGKSVRYLIERGDGYTVEFGNPNYCYIIENPTNEELAIKDRIISLLEYKRA